MSGQVVSPERKAEIMAYARETSQSAAARVFGVNRRTIWQWFQDLKNPEPEDAQSAADLEEKIQKKIRQLDNRWLERAMQARLTLLGELVSRARDKTTKLHSVVGALKIVNEAIGATQMVQTLADDDEDDDAAPHGLDHRDRAPLRNGEEVSPLAAGRAQTTPGPSRVFGVITGRRTL